MVVWIKAAVILFAMCHTYLELDELNLSYTQIRHNIPNVV